MPLSPTPRRVLTVLGAVAAVAATIGLGIVVGRSGGPVDAAGTGDSLYPDIGTSAYDVDHYAIDLTYADGGEVKARTTIRANTTTPLSSFELDFVGLEVDEITVDGSPADVDHTREKVTITPEAPVEGTFTTVVDYHGTPKAFEGEGWLPTEGGATVMSEPIGAMSWFPNNNTPTDKATFDIELTVPDELAAASNGVLASKRSGKDGTTWVWEQPVPMATYLAMVSIGEYQVFKSSMKLADGRTLPIWSFIDRSFGPLKKERRQLKEAIRLGERLYGPYPSAGGGLVVEDISGSGGALETQDRAVYDGVPPAEIIMHETAHQWFGNSVGLDDWGDIWLNEGFATHAEWSWEADHDGDSTAEQLRSNYEGMDEQDPFWSLPPADLGVATNLFSWPVYLRGAMTLEALRQDIGTDDFATLVTTWTERHRADNATTKDFIALAEKISGDDLDAFFEAWLYTPERPVLEP
ncbi:M1 family metallopeptidase [Aeromicrobium sp.]|uniref:M1 family metallopeptidase n=1 Tax=Aeromicrobium sp. TaxID=1871063 RepID=UPI003D6C392A